jgi:hypothetical protein
MCAALTRTTTHPLHHSQVGSPFDPNFHEAIAREANDDVPDGTVLQVCVRACVRACLHVFFGGGRLTVRTGPGAAAVTGFWPINGAC